MENIEHDVIVLTDEPIEQDNRVLKVIAKYKLPFIVRCKWDYVNKKELFSNRELLIVLFKISFFLFPVWKKLFYQYDIKPIGIINGLKGSIQNLLKVLNNHEKEKIGKIFSPIIYANDLSCGYMGFYIAKNKNVQLIYDSHEIAFHRNRKNGLLRVVFDFIVEKKVIDCANEVIVVNKPIKKLYMDIYKIPASKIKIVDNNHFAPHFGYGLNVFKEDILDVSIVYVGGGINGRKLESLAIEAAQTEVKIYGYFLANTPKIAYEYDWILGSKDYLQELMQVIGKNKTIMWACTEDLCLSYKLSLPNKFFQAMALGIPIIAYKDTYLAEIVQQYHIGYIYDDMNFQEIIEDIKDSNKYYRLLESIASFQEKLFIEKLEL